MYYNPFNKENAKSDSDKNDIIYIVKSGPCGDHFYNYDFVNFRGSSLKVYYCTMASEQ